METLFYDLNTVTTRRVIHQCDCCTLLSLCMTLFLQLTLFIDGIGTITLGHTSRDRAITEQVLKYVGISTITLGHISREGY